MPEDLTPLATKTHTTPAETPLPMTLPREAAALARWQITGEER